MKLSISNLINIKLLSVFFLICLSQNCFSNPTIDWQPCIHNPDFQCAMLAVPEDYKNPDANIIHLPITIHHSKNDKLGTIIFNAGGPWYDDVSSLQGLFTELSERIKDNFDLVSFTPRGVAPNAISCHSDQIDWVHDITRELNLTSLNSEEGAQRIYELTLQKRDLCQYDSLSHYGNTKNTVQDMDTLRKSLNVDKINYFGASYGTRLGLAYLTTYPEHVNNMVFDGVVAPQNQLSNFVQGLAPAVENTLHAFFDMCQSSESHCPLHRSSSQEIQNIFQQLLEDAETTGIPTTVQYANRPLSAAMLLNVVTSALGAQATWPQLADALNQAIVTNNADLLMHLYMSITGYDPVTNGYTHYNDSAVFEAVYCTDYNIPKKLQGKSSWLDVMRNLREQYPLGGGAWSTHFAKACIAWPVKSEPLLPEFSSPIVNAKPKVLLVSSTFDPVTPLQWRHAVSDYLTKINVKHKEITWEGAGHGTYHQNAPSNGCIENNIDQFFIADKLPTTGVCKDQTNPFLQHRRQEKYMKS